MFASLKNKIREETGTDLSKFTSKLTTSTAQRIESLRGRSHQGSSSSINSILSSDGQREDTIDALKTDDEYKKRLLKIETDLTRKLEEKEKEWRQVTVEHEKTIQQLHRDNDAQNNQISILKDSLKHSEELQRKLLEHREDKEQIENFQIQELAKVKHLVLLKEQELAEKSASLKEVNQQLEKIRTEVTRLRRQEERLSDVQDDLESLRHSSARDLAALATQLAKNEEERRHLNDLVAIFRERGSNDSDTDQEKKLLEQRLEEAHLHLADIKTSWSDKIAMLETQVGRLSRQAAEEGAERRRAVQEQNTFLEKMKQVECELECNKLELDNKNTKIKRLESEVEELSKELRVLRADSDEEVAFLRKQIQDATVEVKAVRKNLDNTESQLDKSEDECSKLKLSYESEHQANNSLKQLITRLEKDLNEERDNSLNIQKTLTRVTSEKNASLLRNAEISQQMEIIKQDFRRQEAEMTELFNKINVLEKKDVEKELKGIISRLEEQLQEKNQSIKTLQSRLADMKKTLQQELRAPTNFNNCDTSEYNNSVAILTPSQSLTKHFHTNMRKDEDDINFKYLKHVLIKFLTSREYEAQHLIRAVATLLKFSAEEEKLVHDTLEWKMSWFGSRPKPESGQSSKTIPPS